VRAFTEENKELAQRGLKRCLGCHTIKPLEEFYRLVRSIGGVHTRCKSCHQAYREEWVRNNPDYRKNWHLQYTYGITLEDKQAMYHRQGERCPGCSYSFPIDDLEVHHDHKTGRVVSLLCNICNRTAGQAKDDWRRLYRLSLTFRRYEDESKRAA
jgi:hypothetical protein